MKTLKFFSFIISFIILFFSLFSITQEKDSDSFYFPTDYTDVSSEYGYRDIFGSTYFHNGMDFLAPQTSKVYACANGIVTDKGFSNSYGNYIILQHSNGYKSLYGHLSEYFIIDIGDYVTAKDQIANVGPKYLSNGTLNGITTGPHLHFTIFDKDGNTINPSELLKNDLSE